MLKIDFTTDLVFGFNGPSLCLLGNEEDFLKLSKSIVELSGSSDVTIYPLKFDFVENVGENKKVIFTSKEK